MENKKYKITEETHPLDSNLHRIVALVTIEGVVSAGEKAVRENDLQR